MITKSLLVIDSDATRCVFYKVALPLAWSPLYMFSIQLSSISPNIGNLFNMCFCFPLLTVHFWNFLKFCVLCVEFVEWGLDRSVCQQTGYYFAMGDRRRRRLFVPGSFCSSGGVVGGGIASSTGAGGGSNHGPTHKDGLTRWADFQVMWMGDHVAAIIDQVALEGLDGITLQALNTR